VRARIKIPIVVGVMPFTSTKQITRMAFTCGATIPAAVIKRLIAAGDVAGAQARAGVEYACEQLRDLARNGVDGLHIYSMNKPEVAHATHDALVDCGYIRA
jgi:methylenetetrahydrofolate reductase (NADPH)